MSIKIKGDRIVSQTPDRVPKEVSMGSSFEVLHHTNSPMREGSKWAVWVKNANGSRLFKAYGNKSESALIRAQQLVDAFNYTRVQCVIDGVI